MFNNEINLNILKIIADLKIKPSDFMHIFKTKKDLNQAVDYFFTKEKKQFKAL